MKKIFLTLLFVLTAGYAAAGTMPALDGLEAVAGPGAAPAEVRAPAPKPPAYPILKWQTTPGLTFDGARTYVLDNTTCVVRLGFRQGVYNQFWGVFYPRRILSVHSVVKITPDNLIEIKLPNTNYIDEMTVIRHHYADGGKSISVEKGSQADQFTVKACANYSPDSCKEIDTFSFSDIYIPWAAAADAYPVRVLDKTFYMIPQYYGSRTTWPVYGYVLTRNTPSGYYTNNTYNFDFVELFTKYAGKPTVYKPVAYSLVQGLAFVFNGDAAAPAWTVRPMLESELEAAYNESLGTRSGIPAIPAAEVHK